MKITLDFDEFIKAVKTIQEARDAVSGMEGYGPGNETAYKKLLVALMLLEPRAVS